MVVLDNLIIEKIDIMSEEILEEAEVDKIIVMTITEEIGVTIIIDTNKEKVIHIHNREAIQKVHNLQKDIIAQKSDQTEDRQEAKKEEVRVIAGNHHHIAAKGTITQEDMKVVVITIIGNMIDVRDKVEVEAEVKIFLNLEYERRRDKPRKYRERSYS